MAIQVRLLASLPYGGITRIRFQGFVSSNPSPRPSPARGEGESVVEPLAMPTHYAKVTFAANWMPIQNQPMRRAAPSLHISRVGPAHVNFRYEEEPHMRNPFWSSISAEPTRSIAGG